MANTKLIKQDLHSTTGLTSHPPSAPNYYSNPDTNNLLYIISYYCGRNNNFSNNANSYICNPLFALISFFCQIWWNLTIYYCNPNNCTWFHTVYHFWNSCSKIAHILTFCRCSRWANRLMLLTRLFLPFAHSRAIHDYADGYHLPAWHHFLVRMIWPEVTRNHWSGDVVISDGKVLSF